MVQGVVFFFLFSTRQLTIISTEKKKKEREREKEALNPNIKMSFTQVYYVHNLQGE